MSKIFDSLVHSGISPFWPKKEHLNISVQNVISQLEVNDRILGACILNSPWFDSSDSPSLFYSSVSNPTYSKIYYPVYCIRNLSSIHSAIGEINIALEIGYRVFKIHPRFSKGSFSVVYDSIEHLLRLGVFVQLCTYPYATFSSNVDVRTFRDFAHLLCCCAELSNRFKQYICLMHGFGTDILNAHNIVRHNPFLLLDLSMTLMKYRGSSLDLDLKFMFSSFDQRICLGSDYPEWHYDQIILRFDELAALLPECKRDNIASSNLLRALASISYSAA